MNRLMLSRFENDDDRLPKVVLYKVLDGYIHFDSYRLVGTELHLKRGSTRVATIRLNNDRSVSLFKKEFDEVTE